jgi:hypothetical protein
VTVALAVTAAAVADALAIAWDTFTDAVAEPLLSVLAGCWAAGPRSPADRRGDDQRARSDQGPGGADPGAL